MNTHGNKILIIEDDASLRTILSEKLKREGFKITIAKDGVEGLKMSESTKPDLILLDVVMPVMDGVTMLKKLRSNPGTENTPVIIISNLSEIERITEVLQAKQGVVEHLVKSHWSLEDLVKKVKDTLNIYHLLK